MIWLNQNWWLHWIYAWWVSAKWKKKVHNMTHEMCVRFGCDFFIALISWAPNKFLWSVWPQGCFPGTRASTVNPRDIGRSEHYLRTTKLNERQTVCIFNGIYSIITVGCITFGTYCMKLTVITGLGHLQASWWLQKYFLRILRLSNINWIRIRYSVDINWNE